MNFTNPLVVSPHNGEGRWWELVQPLEYRGRDRRITVPAGTITDFASTPRMLWVLLPPFGRYMRAAVVHDHLYRTKGVDRRTADRIFFRIMVESRTRIFRALLMYTAVRWFGWLSWGRRTL